MKKIPDNGQNVFFAIGGRIFEGKVINVFEQKFNYMMPGTHFQNGFKIRWFNGEEPCISEHHMSEYGTSIFADKKELIEVLKNQVPVNPMINLQQCRDYYGLALNLGDQVTLVCPIHGRTITGYVGKIYKYSSESSMNKRVYINLVDQDGYFIAVEQDPRCFTTLKRNSFIGMNA